MDIITGNFGEILTKTLEKANHSFYLSTFIIETPDRNKSKILKNFWDLLFQKSKEIDLKIICDIGIGVKGAEKNMIALVKFLNNKTLEKFNKLDIRLFSGYYKLHAKFFIADLYYCYIGSHNITSKSLNNNLDLGIYAENQALAERLKEIFFNFYRNSINIKGYKIWQK